MVDLVDSEGKTQSYPFRSEYIVAKPSLVVSPTKMNVLYRGIENPVDISVPGVPSENIIATISGGHRLIKKSNGKYVAKMSKSKENAAHVRVSARMTDGSTKPMGNMEFRVLRLPTPQAYLGNITGSDQITTGMCKALQGISARYDESFVFELTCKVIKYDVTVINKRGDVYPPVRNSGGRFSEDTKRLLSKVKRGDRIYYENIKAVGEDGQEHNLGPIVVKIR